MDAPIYKTMEMETCQTFDSNNLQTTLEEAGYRLTDYGDHWRCAAAYRGGTNQMSLKIYKNSGVWSDFGHQNTPLPIHFLLGKIFGPNHPKVQEFKNGSINGQTTYYQPTQTIEMERVYPENVLEKLFPNFNFYTSKGYSYDTLKSLRAGLAGTGKMYRRVVFPIFDANKQIIGFSGRKIDDDNPDKPKWKHLGKKKNWVYPANIPTFTKTTEAITESGEVILVESIGDMMSLFENGIFNVLVTFGLGCSPAIISFLSQFSIEKIIIVPNNDIENKENNGLIGALGALVDLSFYFNHKNIFISVPPNDQNDLGECFEKKIPLAEWALAKRNRQETLDIIDKYKKLLPFASKKKLDKILS